MPYVTVEDGTRIHYEEYGPADTHAAGTGAARPLLFLHGWGTSGRVWDGQLAEFAAAHRVVTVDWRGCGRSDRPMRGNNTDTVLADLVTLIGTLGLGKPVAIGSSIGATFATELAARRPDLVGGAVAVDGPAHWPSEHMPIAAFRAELRANKAAMLSGWVPKWFAGGTAPALIERTIGQILESGVFVEEQFADAAVYDPRPRLAAGLDVPLHYIHGEFDSEIPLNVPRALAALTPGSQMFMIPGAGHMCQLELPVEFNAALRSALALIPAPALARAGA